MHTLTDLPYDKRAFAPFITEEGFDYHHGKHHQTYVNNLNLIIRDSELAELDVHALILLATQTDNAPLFNAAAQHYNHTFYWDCISPSGGGAARGKIATLIDRDFGSFDSFREQFSNTSTKLFGSGWTWLVLDEKGRLAIEPMKDAHTPLIHGRRPLLTLDVWEHAYYIDHRNQRPRFIEGFWEVVNWDFANRNLEELAP